MRKSIIVLALLFVFSVVLQAEVKPIASTKTYKNKGSGKIVTTTINAGTPLSKVVITYPDKIKPSIIRGSEFFLQANAGKTGKILSVSVDGSIATILLKKTNKKTKLKVSIGNLKNGTKNYSKSITVEGE